MLSWTETPNCFEGHSTDDNRGLCHSFYSCSSFNKSVLASGIPSILLYLNLLFNEISCNYLKGVCEFVFMQEIVLTAQ